MTPRSLAAVLVIVPPLSGLLWLGGAVPFHLAMAAVAVLVLVVVCAGELLLRAADAPDLPVAAAWVMGTFSTGLAVYGLAAGLQMLASAAFTVWAVFVVAGMVLFGRREEAEASIDAPEVLGLVLCAAATWMWCRDIAEAPAILASERSLPAWIDHFIHAGVISQFGDPLAAARGSIDLAGFARPLYHYASYMLAAVFAAPLDVPGLTLSTSLWLPLGFFTMCAGAYSLGAALAGPAGGLAGVASLALLPDASNYGLRNGFMSFHWSAMTHPGALYGIGIALLALALLQRTGATGRPRALAAAFCLSGGMAVFRVHLFALAFPATLASAAMASRWVRGHRVVTAAVALAGLALFVGGFYVVTDSVPALELFVANVHDLHAPTAYDGWYAALLENWGRGVAVPLGLVGMLAACLGAFLLLYPMVALLRWRVAGMLPIDLAPHAFLACYILLAVTAPISRHGDATELTQRPFVLLYAVIAVWTSAALVACLAARIPRAAKRMWPGLLAASALSLLLLWPHARALALPKFYWGWQHVVHAVAPGLPQAASFLRQAAMPGEVFAVDGLRLGWVATDAATEITALSGVPAYIARPFIHVSKGGLREREALARHAALARVAAEPDVAAARNRLRELGIAWYVVVGDVGPRWDRRRESVAFAAGRVALYAVNKP